MAAGRTKAKSRGVQCGVDMVQAEAQTESMEVAAVAVQTELPAVEAERERNPAREPAVSERVIENVQNAVVRATLHRDRDGKEVTERVLLDRYQEEVQFEEISITEMASIKALLKSEYIRSCMERQIEEATVEKRQANKPRGSMSENTEKEGSEMKARNRKAKQPCGQTALVLKNEIRKDKEIRSREPKIPWWHEAK